MTASSCGGTAGEQVAALTAPLSAALAAGSREAFTALLTEDVHWGGEHGGDECNTRDQAGDHYAGLLAAGIDVRPADLHQIDSTLRNLLAEHHITAAVTLIRIDTDDDAQTHHFLGSPTVRINGHDVEPAGAERQRRDADGEDAHDAASRYGMQCRLYSTPEGTAGTPRDEWIIDALADNGAHEAAITAIHTGDLAALHQLLAERPTLASTRLPRHQGRTLLHIATDWPGHYPNVAATITALAAAGADPDAPSLGKHSETPLHWAASSDDIAAIDALLDNGADINAPGAVIAGGTPMADATAFGQWHAARRLLERGAATNLFEAATLGLVAEVKRHLDTNQPTADDITSSFWGACHGGHISTATVLRDHGADINWIGYDNLTPLDTARRSEATAVAEWLEQHGATSADQPA